jgi:hypothetical protein
LAFRTKNSCEAELFLRSVVKLYEKYPVYTDGQLKNTPANR